MKHMHSYIRTLILIFIWSISTNYSNAQDTTSSTPMIDVVWLRDGSRLSGTILRWELPRGMEFKLLTGAILVIPKSDILKVHQQMNAGSEESIVPPQVRLPRPYAFKEEGLYHTFSGFLNTSFSGGAGLHYSIGHRFHRWLGVGIGLGYESNDLDRGRKFVPVLAEVRGFLLPRKITPYYALKVGYGFAVNRAELFSETAKGGWHFSPELGVRFGGSHVNFFAGAQYKLQTATYRTEWNSSEFISDKITYKRLELRAGIIF